VLPLLQEQRGDQEAAQDEEDVDAEKPAGEIPRIVQHHRENRDAAQAIERREVGQAE
jgi:hypothetical protein